jgi:hypothetical protein
MTAGLSAALMVTVIAGCLGLLALWRRAESERKLMEASRDAAQANYQVASQSLNELSTFVSKSITDRTLTQAIPPYFESALERTRLQQRELTRRNAVQPGSLEQLANIDLVLASIYSSRGRMNDSRPLLEECIDLWDRIIDQGGDEPHARIRQLGALMYLARTDARLSDARSIAWWNDRAVPIYQCLSAYAGPASGPFALPTLYADNLFALSSRERVMADSLALRGDPAAARQFLEGRLRLFTALTKSRPGSLDLEMCRLLTCAALANTDEKPLGSCRRLLESTPPGNTRESLLISALAEFTARSCGLIPLGPESTRSLDASDDRDMGFPESATFLREQGAILALGPDAIVHAAMKLCHLTTAAGAEQRHLGKHAGARRTADRLCAFANGLVLSFPDHAEAYLVLSEAELQRAKNAWRTGDRVAVEQSLRQSLHAAKRAATLAPSSADAHVFVIDREKRLAEFEPAETQKSLGALTSPK